MPIIKDFDLNFNSRVIIWEITELETQLISMLKLSKKDKTLLNSIKLDSKRKEFVVIRLILIFLNIETNNLIYDTYGKPLLKLNKFISISHCLNILVLALSTSEIGVDIEKERKKISIVKQKFLSKFENNFLNRTDQDKMLTRIWTSKEAVYKIINMSGISFKKNIIINPFKLQDSFGNATVKTENFNLKFKLKFITFREYYLTLAYK
tara:strand:+ start:89134 stop:89757 length:624 start_codon:yes stop_codon:yes gene_type:complete